jgi:hypothetical protein
MTSGALAGTMPAINGSPRTDDLRCGKASRRRLRPHSQGVKTLAAATLGQKTAKRLANNRKTESARKVTRLRQLC